MTEVNVDRVPSYRGNKYPSSIWKQVANGAAVCGPSRRSCRHFVG